MLKDLKSQNLRDHMSEAELIFTALAELSTRQIAESEQAKGFVPNAKASKKGGAVAKNARKELESKTGKSVVTGENLKKEVITLIINVYRANCRDNKEKLPLLQSGRENVEVVRLLLRLLQDLKQIGLKEFISANESLESVSKQMAAWANSLSKPKVTTSEIKQGFEGQSLEGLFAFQESAG
ncbi:hypothetical protein FACS189428_5830 [Clostridia bacterium]|nr:hypothetical protein FACS189428_5830 [Clostridia bacterium]